MQIENIGVVISLCGKNGYKIWNKQWAIISRNCPLRYKRKVTDTRVSERVVRETETDTRTRKSNATLTTVNTESVVESKDTNESNKDNIGTSYIRLRSTTQL